MNLRCRIDQILLYLSDMTHRDTAPGGWIGGEDLRRFDLDLETGRAALRGGHRAAQRALEALNRGDDDLARSHLEQAEGLLTGLQRALGGLQGIKGPANYGRAPSDRNQRFRSLVDDKKGQTTAKLSVVDAARLVFAERPDLAREFVNATDRALQEAYRRGKP